MPRPPSIAPRRRPIKQIALAVGFRNEKSFSRAFRAWAGVTPGAYRRQGGSRRLTLA